MPIYEYQCNLCGARHEAIQKMSDAALTECPECHKPGLQKLVSAAGFQLKGTGWYVTDFRDKNKTESKQPNTAHTSGVQSEKPKDDKSSSSTSTSGDKT